MSVLVVFGTTEGHTQKVAEKVKSILAELGEQVELYDCTRRPRDLDVKKFDAIIVAGSIHQQRHQRSVENFVSAHLHELEAVPSALLSVSISAAFKEGQKDAQSYVDELIKRTGWQTPQTLLVAGALKHSEYDYFMEQFVQHVVLKGRHVDEMHGDYVFTDWDALSQFITSFADLVRTQKISS